MVTAMRFPVVLGALNASDAVVVLPTWMARRWVSVIAADAGVTAKLTPLLATLLTVTTTGPVVAPPGTGTAMLVGLQLVGVVAVPLNVTVLVPCVVPKFVPLIVTGVPTGPEVWDRLVMVGA